MKTGLVDERSHLWMTGSAVGVGGGVFVSDSSEKLPQSTQRESGSGLHLLLTREVERGPAGLCTGWNPVESKGRRALSSLPHLCLSSIVFLTCVYLEEDTERFFQDS